LRIAICDDNPEFLAQIQTMLHNWDHQPSVFITEVFEDGDSLIHAHTASHFDIILLDVVMPLLNGIETAKEIRLNDKAVKIVFLTSSSDFAVDSYTVKASNYLLKPLNPDKIYQCLDELTEEILQSARSITIKSANAVHRVEIETIEYIEAQNKHIIFCFSNGRMITAIDPLYTYEDKLLLKDGFYKCNRSYIVNIYKIDTYTPKEIIMRSGYRIPISRSYHKKFESVYFELLFGQAGDK